MQKATSLGKSLGNRFLIDSTVLNKAFDRLFVFFGNAAYFIAK
jgi:hypothetical protein